MSEPERPKNALDAAAWVHSEGGGPENLNNILIQIDALRDSLLKLTLSHPSIADCLDALRPLERYIKDRLRHIQALSDAYEAEGWQLDAKEPGGFRSIPIRGVSGAPTKGLNAYIYHLCRNLNITSNDRQARDRIAERLPPGIDGSPRGPIGRAIDNYLRTLRSRP